MNIHSLSVQMTHGRWFFKKNAVSGNESLIDKEVRLIASEVGEKKLLAIYSEYRKYFGTWALELPKMLSTSDELAIGYGCYLADQCISNPDEKHTIYADASELSIKACMTSLKAKGEPVAGYNRVLLKEYLRFFLAIPIASVYIIFTLLKVLFENSKINKNNNIIVAIHGELSTRTKHLLEIVNQSEKRKITIIVLGRPKLALKELSDNLWKDILNKCLFELVRPINIVSACKAIPLTLKWTLTGLKSIQKFPISLGIGTLAAIHYRGHLGMTSAVWWERLDISPRVVVYGHTGIADTSELELAQQAQGVRTVHLLHGLSAGINFAGYSTIVRTQTRMDAYKHRIIGGYGSYLSPKQVKPNINRGSSGWLLLSNLVHPMNKGFQNTGVRDEIELLNMIARAADGIGVKRQNIIYKPHPVLYSMNSVTRDEIFSEVSSLKFTIWNEKHGLSYAKKYEYVFCTPSTVVVDILKLGVLPIVIHIQSNKIEQKSLQSLPVEVCAYRDIYNLIDELKSEVKYRDLYNKVWKKVSPCTPFLFDELLSLYK